jgi:phosphoribosylanthranilate isomerase
MIKVKICGIQNLADAQVAAEAGADFVGVVFVPERRRRIEPDTAREICDGLRVAATAPKVVGLFADQPLEEINRIVETCQLDLVQLCGSESIEYAAGVARPVIKVIHVPGTVAPEAVFNLGDRLHEFRDAGHLVTLDRLVEGVQGGTGRKFDWEVASSLSRRGHSFLLAGGLTPNNVGRAIGAVRPWGVDVSSGVETRGQKDHRKILDFTINARETAATLAGSG